jgi:hypothetical protein
LAFKRKNLSLCNRITDEVEKSGCYGGVAIAKNDLSLCKEVADDLIRIDCYTQIAVLRLDPSICTSMIDKEGYVYIGIAKIDSCYWKVSLAAKDTTICEKIDTQSTRENCELGEKYFE